MSYSYEAIIPNHAVSIFERGFCDYMMKQNFDHMSIGGRLGGRSAHQFRRDDHIVSLALLPEGQSHTALAVNSDTLPVEQLILDALTEGTADFLQHFCEGISNMASNETLQSMIASLRKAFDSVTDSSS